MYGFLLLFWRNPIEDFLFVGCKTPTEEYRCVMVKHKPVIDHCHLK